MRAELERTWGPGRCCSTIPVHPLATAVVAMPTPGQGAITPASTDYHDNAERASASLPTISEMGPLATNLTCEGLSAASGDYARRWPDATLMGRRGHLTGNGGRVRVWIC